MTSNDRVHGVSHSSRRDAVRTGMVSGLTLVAALGAATLLTANAVGAPTAGKAPVPMGDDLTGAWTHDPTLGVNPTRAKPDDKDFRLSDGTVIPLRPAAEKIYRSRVVMGTTDHAFANTSSRCLPIGTPGNMMGAPYPVEIVQAPNFIGMLFEEGWMFRTIFMEDKHPDEVIPSFMGHSIGHWEGKTLVIDTVSLRSETTLNFTGLPHSEKMHVVEHLKRTDPNTLVDSITVDDPEMYTKPFTFTSIFKKTDEELIEYICENSKVEITPDGRQTYGDAPK